MITKARKYLRLLVVLLGASISAQMEYRANFLVNLIGSLAASGGALFGLGVVYGGSTTVGGWSYREAVVVVGLFVLIDGFTGAFLFPNLNRIAESVRLGTMDFTLMKPIDGQFLISAREINVFRLVDVLVGLGLTVWALAGLPHVSASDLLLGLGLLISALAIVYAICFMLSVTAFWFVNVANVIELFYGLFRAGQFPITAFPVWVRVLFTFVIPVAFITTVPSAGLVGRGSLAASLGAVALAAALLLTSRRFWRFAVGNYTSASS